MAEAEEMVLTARWIFPVATHPLERGTVTIRGTIISGVHPAGERTADIDFGNAAIIPGLVNAHTHLDLSGTRGRIPPTADFTAWLKAIIAHRNQQPRERIGDDVNTGLAEALRFGTTLIGDISAAGGSWPILKDARCWSVVFHEILGLPGPRVIPAWRAASEWLDQHPDSETCRVGLSPHAPYSVHQALFRAAGTAGSPLTIHLAETSSEKELLERHLGPMADFLAEIGVFDADGLAPSLDWIIWRCERAPAVLLAHGNYLAPDTQLARHTTIVYCPRTHAAFGHPPHPFREFLARRVRIALGTDSLASSPDLDVLAEARFIHERCADVSGEQLLRMATLAGAEALGAEARTGSLEMGKSADLVVVPLPEFDSSAAHRLLFEPGAAIAAPRRTMWRGEWR